MTGRVQARLSADTMFASEPEPAVDATGLLAGSEGVGYLGKYI